MAVPLACHQSASLAVNMSHSGSYRADRVKRIFVVDTGVLRIVIVVGPSVDGVSGGPVSVARTGYGM